MKKIVSISLILALSLSLAACKGGTDETSSTAAPSLTEISTAATELSETSVSAAETSVTDTEPSLTETTETTVSNVHATGKIYDARFDDALTASDIAAKEQEVMAEYGFVDANLVMSSIETEDTMANVRLYYSDENKCYLSFFEFTDYDGNEIVSYTVNGTAAVGASSFATKVPDDPFTPYGPDGRYPEELTENCSNDVTTDDNGRVTMYRAYGTDIPEVYTTEYDDIDILIGIYSYYGSGVLRCFALNSNVYIWGPEASEREFYYDESGKCVSLYSYRDDGLYCTVYLYNAGAVTPSFVCSYLYTEDSSLTIDFAAY